MITLKFKNRFVQKIFDWNPLKEKYSIDLIMKSFQRGYRYRYYEMLTLLNVDPDLKRFVQKIFDWNPLKEKYTLDPELTETCRTILIKYFHWRYWIIACSFWLKSNYHALFSKCRFLWENNLQLLWLLALMKNKQSSVCKSTEPSRPLKKKLLPNLVSSRSDTAIQHPGCTVNSRKNTWGLHTWTWIAFFRFLISPFNISSESHIKVTRIEEMITLLIVKQILLVSAFKMYRT